MAAKCRSGSDQPGPGGRDRRRATTPTGPPTKRTIQKMLVLLFGVIGRAKRRKWIDANPCEDVERVTIKRSGDFNVLSPVEVAAVAREADGEQDAAIFTVAAFTGLRLGAAHLRDGGRGGAAAA